jgi:hypothetical protein
MAMQRIWREHGLLKARKKKYQRKQDLAYIKAPGRYFSKSAPIPRILTIFLTTDRRLSSSAARLTHIVVTAVTHSIPSIRAPQSRAVQGSAQLDFAENKPQSKTGSDRILGIARILGVER